MSDLTIKSPSGSIFKITDLEHATSVSTSFALIVKTGTPYTHYACDELGEILVDRKGKIAYRMASAKGKISWDPSEARARTSKLCREFLRARKALSTKTCHQSTIQAAHVREFAPAYQ